MKLNTRAHDLCWDAQQRAIQALPSLDFSGLTSHATYNVPLPEGEGRGISVHLQGVNGYCHATYNRKGRLVELKMGLEEYRPIYTDTHSVYQTPKGA